jgi:N-acetylglucosamine kinase-like BadF-type ATPase
MKLFLGVDGGQTSTRMVLGDGQGMLLAQAKGGPSNHTEEPGGPERLKAVTQSMLKELLHAAGYAAAENVTFVAACFGMTGELEIKRRVIAPLLTARHLSIVHDSVSALDGATAGEPGIIIIAGTGSVARGRNRQGRELCMGGWGHAFGDEGSAYWIGREVVRAVLAEFDQMGDKTRLTPMLHDRLGIQSPHELIRRYYSGAFSRDQLAGLAPWADEAAEAGDAIAQTILKRAGLELSRLANALLQKLSAGTPPVGSRLSPAPRVYYSGGAFNSATILSSFTNGVRTSFPACLINPPQLLPVLGSLLRAYRADNANVGDALRAWPTQFNSLARQGE